MATIVRGHSYDLTDICNAQSLNDLVERAQISGLSVGDLPNSGAQVSVFSAASGAADGWISAQYDRLFATSNASFAEFNYVLTTPNGQVALFKPYGLETRRFFNVDDLYLTGSAFLIKALGGASPVTLRCSIGYSAGTPRADFLGASIATAPSGFAPRLVIKGVAPGRVVDAGGPAVRHYWVLFNATTGQWQHISGATDTDKVAGFTLDHRLSGDATIPSYFFGGPVFRA